LRSLISEDAFHHEDNVENLIARYIAKQLIFLPGGTKQFDLHVVATDWVLRQALIEGGLPLDEVPASLYTHIMEQQDKKTRTHLLTILKVLQNAHMMSLPTNVDDVVNASLASPLKWKPNLMRTPAQSIESFEEQKAAIQLAMQQANKYQCKTTMQTKGMLINGGPGTGKMTCMEAISLLCMSRGLNTNLGTMMAEQGKQLSGQHFSKWFLIPVNKQATPG